MCIYVEYEQCQCNVSHTCDSDNDQDSWQCIHMLIIMKCYCNVGGTCDSNSDNGGDSLLCMLRLITNNVDGTAESDNGKIVTMYTYTTLFASNANVMLIVTVTRYSDNRRDSWQCIYIYIWIMNNADAVLLLPVLVTNGLTHCGLSTPYDDIGLGQHWLR